MANRIDDGIEWSSETFSFITIVNDKLPTIVKVADGYYCENEAESFSNGDLIKLDFKRHYTKVKARPVGTNLLEGKDDSNIGSEILIPLGYCGKLHVHCLKDTFHSMKDLVEYFPRFIKVGVSFNAHKGKRWTIPIRIHTGAELELDREIPDMGIVCRINQTKILVSYDAEVLCYLIPDKTPYTIREVVETFKMPQYVRFIDSEMERVMTENLNEAIDNITHFEGFFKITGIFRQEVVIGHHKPAGVLPSTSGFSCQRSIAILPLDSEVVQNLEVYAPIYDDFVDYELMTIRNFSTNVNMDVVEGSLYLEFQKKPMVHLLPSNELPPPRPPLPSELKIMLKSYLGPNHSKNLINEIQMSKQVIKSKLTNVIR
ncbi:uncharacterized protein LOC134232895 [Saccostrea cucullata]|uniref:uncharacterized protein LOC134232895 n=1 Tax=Saccostrea cuccullata TaxID=36930 RepID=UPI002ED456BD